MSDDKGIETQNSEETTQNEEVVEVAAETTTAEETTPQAPAQPETPPVAHDDFNWDAGNQMVSHYSKDEFDK